MVCPWNYLRAHAGFQYLADALHFRGFHIKVYARIPRNMLVELAERPYAVMSRESAWYARIPLVRRVLFRREIIRAWTDDADAMLCYDLGFFREAVEIKRQQPSKLLVLVSPDIFAPEDCPGNPFVEFYEKHANVPDVTVDVEPHRAEWRKTRFGLRHDVLVIPNTLPSNEAPPAAAPGTLRSLAGADIPGWKHVIVFAGGLYPGVPLERLVRACAMLKERVFLLAFCHGPPQRIAALRQLSSELLGPQSGRISGPVPRRALLSCLWEASAGLVFYPPSAQRTVNQLYCAPAKFFEYLAAGIPVVTTANESLRPIVTSRDVGAVARDDSAEAFAEAIDALLSRSDLPEIRRRARKLFLDELCYEKAAEPALSRLCGMIEEATSARR